MRGEGGQVLLVLHEWADEMKFAVQPQELS